MSYLFAGASLFNENITMWDVGMVEDMGNMFIAAYAFNQDIAGWNTSSVKNMNRMFLSHRRLGYLERQLYAWDVRRGHFLQPGPVRLECEQRAGMLRLLSRRGRLDRAKTDV